MMINKHFALIIQNSKFKTCLPVRQVQNYKYESSGSI